MENYPSQLSIILLLFTALFFCWCLIFGGVLSSAWWVTLISFSWHEHPELYLKINNSIGVVLLLTFFLWVSRLLFLKSLRHFVGEITFTKIKHYISLPILLVATTLVMPPIFVFLSNPHYSIYNNMRLFLGSSTQRLVDRIIERSIESYKSK